MVPPEIKKCPLFTGINAVQLEALLNCLKAVMRTCEKGDFVFRAEGRIVSVGVVLTGSVHVIQEDFWGNRAILAHIEPGGLFGESFSCADADKLPVSMVSAEKSKIMLIDYRKIATTCSSACVFHARLIKNMLHILAENNITLTKKITHLSKRTTRDKLLSFLSHEATCAKSNVVSLPFNRQELADYLCVDRSALSRELAKMQREGLLQYDKSCFVLFHKID